VSAGRDRIRRIREPDLTELRNLYRAEAMRIAMIMYAWDAETAARRVDLEQRRRAEEMTDQTNQLGA
jgi:hypothetical protein